VVTKCSKYSAHDLRSRVLIERNVRTEDGQGGYTQEWVEVGRPWTKWKPLSGNERFQAMRVDSDIGIRAVIRFRGDERGRPFYYTGDRVTYLDRQYDIESVIDVDNEHKWLEISMNSLPDGFEYSANLGAIVAPSAPTGNWELEAGGTWELEAGGNWELE
jgi:SPP1 family predicted phage head-tail adaptor